MKKSVRKLMGVLAAAVFLGAATCCSPGQNGDTTASDTTASDTTASDTAASGEAASKEAASGGTASDADGVGRSVSGSDETEAREHMLAVWSDYLRVQEEMYASSLWALDYVEAFLDSREWDDLAKARTACIASARCLSELSMQEEDLSEEEYLLLAKAGADTGFQSVQIESLDIGVDGEHDFIRGNLLERLESGLFLESEVEEADRLIGLHRDYLMYLREGECLTTNYLLLTLGDPTAAQSFWQELPERYPILWEGKPEWSDSEADLEKRMEECLDQQEEVSLGMADALSIAGANLYWVDRNMEEQEQDKLLEDVFLVENAPKLLPMPKWYDPQNAGYLSFIQEEDGSITYPESGTELGDGLYGVYLEIEGISVEEIEEYAEAVRGYGQEVRKDRKSELWDIGMGEYNVQISLEGDTVTVIFYGQDVTFVPEWYLGIG